MFVCALRPRGEPLTQDDVFGYVTRLRRGLDESLHSVVEGPFAAMAIAGTGESRARLARWRHLVGAGEVRIDNAAEVAELAGLAPGASVTDLELVLAAIDRTGEACIPKLIGDFAFVVWDPNAQKLLAVRDAFGVRPLYHSGSSELVLYASAIAPLYRDNPLDADFVSGFLAGSAGVRERTVWGGIGSVAAGSFVRHRGTVRSRTVYWRADDFAPADSDAPADAARFRALLEEAVRTRVRGAEPIWAQLSGGLDSSTIVALAATTAPDRLHGTITVVDSLGEGDERRYSDAVVARYGLRNEQVQNCWAWQDDGEPPPLTPQPSPMYPFHVRDRRVGDIVRGSGGRVMLTGIGADHYLHGTLDYITDLAETGSVGAALSELTTWSVATRQSFWRLGRRYLLEPFLPRLLQARQAPPPPWVTGALAALGAARPAARAGSRFASSIAAGIAALPAWIDEAAFGPGIELRHPFLHRPLVEWSLRLPPRHRVRPHARKWILREAARDLLPEQVRTRSTKGGIDGRILWSLQHERHRIDALLRDSILAQHGFIDALRLRHEVEQARCGVPVNNVQLFSALSLETWLAVRAGRWDAALTSKAA